MQKSQCGFLHFNQECNTKTFFSYENSVLQYNSAVCLQTDTFYCLKPRKIDVEYSQY